MIWDADMLPVNPWPVSDNKFALLQDNSGGNPEIVKKWEIWIKKVLNVDPVVNSKSTFYLSSYDLKSSSLESFKKQIQKHYKSDENWLKLLIKSFNDYETFSEYWAYASWVNEKAKNDLKYFEYKDYGDPMKDSFDDGTGLFSSKLKKIFKKFKIMRFFIHRIHKLKILLKKFIKINCLQHCHLK